MTTIERLGSPISQGIEIDHMLHSLIIVYPSLCKLIYRMTWRKSSWLSLVAWLKQRKMWKWVGVIKMLPYLYELVDAYTIDKQVPLL